MIQIVLVECSVALRVDPYFGREEGAGIIREDTGQTQ